jgi:hypothetical protein
MTQSEKNRCEESMSTAIATAQRNTRRATRMPFDSLGPLKEHITHQHATPANGETMNKGAILSSEQLVYITSKTIEA